MAYGYIGSMKTQPGKRDDVVAILLSGADSLRELGCRSYVVGLADDDLDTIVVTEVWDSKDHHDASLRLPEAKQAIAAAMPMLTGEFTSRELVIVGGLGAGD
ncbi:MULTISPECIES: putative quinol monooxygenase [unclassified Streptomyces]|uniref:putative quinol monooxygenase n=1 Tax=unclassified Streptomyces TaxID=2593676 RepID=UPI002556D551|nr:MULTISPECIES: putative quinol monooxygenase [unclassified Streptomyces]WRZ62445.1 antibiotic biosynthesis monooxygenase [Streptomyces sp. NBC_01257]WSU56415.1 antibiotic biosynthesis monooxygenase [Streptomyces sp. NBC_01104]